MRAANNARTSRIPETEARLLRRAIKKLCEAIVEAAADDVIRFPARW